MYQICIVHSYFLDFGIAVNCQTDVRIDSALHLAMFAYTHTYLMVVGLRIDLLTTSYSVRRHNATDLIYFTFSYVSYYSTPGMTRVILFAGNNVLRGDGSANGSLSPYCWVMDLQVLDLTGKTTVVTIITPRGWSSGL